MTRKTRSQKMMEELTGWAEKYECLRGKEVEALVALIKKNAKVIDVAANNKFIEMVKNRQCVKFYGVSEKDFNEMLKRQLEEAKALFARAKNLSAEEVKKIEEVKKRSATARRKTVSDKDIDDIIKNLDK